MKMMEINNLDVNSKKVIEIEPLPQKSSNPSSAQNNYPHGNNYHNNMNNNHNQNNYNPYSNNNKPATPNNNNYNNLNILNNNPSNRIIQNNNINLNNNNLINLNPPSYNNNQNIKRDVNTSNRPSSSKPDIKPRTPNQIISSNQNNNVNPSLSPNMIKNPSIQQNINIGNPSISPNMIKNPSLQQNNMGNPNFNQNKNPLSNNINLNNLRPQSGQKDVNNNVNNYLKKVNNIQQPNSHNINLNNYNSNNQPHQQNNHNINLNNYHNNNPVQKPMISRPEGSKVISSNSDNKKNDRNISPIRSPNNILSKNQPQSNIMKQIEKSPINQGKKQPMIDINSKPNARPLSSHPQNNNPLIRPHSDRDQKKININYNNAVPDRNRVIIEKIQRNPINKVEPSRLQPGTPQNRNINYNQINLNVHAPIIKSNNNPSSNIRNNIAMPSRGSNPISNNRNSTPNKK